MKLIFCLLTILGAAVADAACEDDLGTFTKSQLSTGRLDRLAGQVVTILDSRGRRAVHGLLIVAHQSGPSDSRSLGVRILNYASGEINLLDYGRGTPALKSITTHGVAPEIRAAERRDDPDGGVRGPLVFLPHDSNVNRLRRDFKLDHPVTVIVAIENSSNLEVLDGMIKLPSRISRDEDYLQIETVAGLRRVHQLRIVAAYGVVSRF